MNPDIIMNITGIMIIVLIIAFITFTSIYEHQYYKQLKEEKDGTL